MGRAFSAWLITVTLVVWVISLAVYKTSYFQNCLGEYEERYHTTHKPEEKPPPSPIPLGVNAWHDTACTFEFVENYGESVIAVATIVLVLVTAVLALYTAKLWGETRKLAIEASESSRKQRRQTTLALGVARKSAAQQARDMKESLRIAQQSANAATMTAESMLQLERPSVVITDIGVRRTGSAPAMHDIDIRLMNYGRTPAFITRISWNSAVTFFVPELPIYTLHEEMPSLVIRPENSESFTTRNTALRLNDEQRAEIEDGRPVWVWVRIRFRDSFGGFGEVGAVASYWFPFRGDGNFFVGGGVTLLGPDAYRYRRHFPEGDPQSE